MDWDEPSKPKKPQPKDLAPLGVQELQDYIADLKTEIARAEAEIAKRGSHLTAAQALFRKD